MADLSGSDGRSPTLTRMSCGANVSAARTERDKAGAARRQMTPKSIRRSQVRFIELYARVVLVAAWWSLARLITPNVRPLDTVDDAFALLNLPVGASVFSAVLLFILGGAARRRMRSAWWLLLGFQLISAGYSVAVLTRAVVFGERLDPIEPTAAVATALTGVLTFVLVIMLFWTRAAFTSRLEKGALWRSVWVLGSGLVLSTAASIALTLSAPGHLRDTSHKFEWAIRVVIGLKPDRSDIGWVGQYGHGWITDLAGLLSGLALIISAVLFVRSARARSCLSAQDELDLRGLLAAHGDRDSLGYFATRRDKAVIFTRTRDAALTYRVMGNVSLVSADPVGPPARWPDVIGAWLRDARASGWFPAVLSASEAGAQAYVAAGLKAIPMGDEAIIDTANFSLDGPAMQPVRQATRRIARLGYTVTVHRHAELGADRLAQLQACAHDWRVDATERGFSMALGRLGDPLDGHSVAVLAHDGHGQLRGMLSLVPWGQRGLSLDLMRRDRSSDNGLNEAMIAALARSAREDLGVTRVSLNFAMFGGVFSAAERVGARPMVRLTSRLMRFASRFWQIESLYRSNARYQPDWITRYLCYDSPLTLTRVALAAGAAEGFIPVLGGRLVEPRRLGDEQVAYAGSVVPLHDAVLSQEAALSEAAVRPPRPTQQQRARLAKLEVLRAHGLEPYPASVPRTLQIGDVRTKFAHLDRGERSGHRAAVVGRIRSLRDFGGLTFLVLQQDQARVQAILTADLLGPREHTLARRCLDLGDLISVDGQIASSEQGELSILVDRWTMAAKCLTPVPKLQPESSAGGRRRSSHDRNVELIVDPRASQLLSVRARTISELRAAFGRRDYLEVETPMLQAVHGGAAARPFTTHMNAYDMPLSLRIAPELQLKRLCVSGLEQIFELNRNFRNEGVDDTHNPEFTSIEAYRAFADYYDMQQLTRDVILEVATAVHGAPIAHRRLPTGRTIEVDLSGPWSWVSVHEAVSIACGARITPESSAAELVALCREHAIAVGAQPTAGALVVKLYEQLVEPATVEPTFYADFPIETSPLTRAHRADVRLAERWDLVADGHEIGTAYSELNDPIEQRARLTAQSLKRAAGDPEAMQLDEQFLSALSYAMPPTGGLGIGVDRLIMLLTGATIRETLAFPFAGRGSLPDA